MSEKPTLYLIIGLPASGKSTVAKRLSEAYRLPVLEKDEIKEVLFDTIGYNNYPEKRRLDVVANEELLFVAGKMLDAGISLIVVNNFRKDMEGVVSDFLKKHNANAKILRLKGNADVFYERYAERDKAKARHIGHILPDHYPLHEGETCDYIPTREGYRQVFELLGMDDFHVDCPEISVDTTVLENIDFDKIAEDFRRL